MVNDPILTYKLNRDRYANTLRKIQKYLFWIGLLRLAIFSATLFLVYYYLTSHYLMLLSGIIGTFIFFIVFFISLNLKHRERKLTELVKLNDIEINALHGNFILLDSGHEFSDLMHFYSNDIDLFGKDSFFQSINRTCTIAGKLHLSNLINKNNEKGIEHRQEIIKELSTKVTWRQNFSTTANLVKNTTPILLTLKWIQNHQALLPKHILKIVLVFSSFTISIFFGIFFDYLIFSHLVVWIFVGLGISSLFVSKVNKIYDNSSKSRVNIELYYKLLEMIENETYHSRILISMQEKLRRNNKNASLIFQKFSKALDALDQRNNLLFAFIGNSLFLWDLWQAYKIEKWILSYKHYVSECFEIVSFFDAQNSLANFAFNHPNYTFPEITDTDTVIHAKDLGHPLLDIEKRITNDCLINSKTITIVTGSNMAGKSTFLRTVSLSIVMANIGLPVCASEMKYSPVKLITSMRTVDSLAKDTSYFFSELKRLKLIVEALQQEHYFVVLDEILKGTNSIDKAEGSKQFLEKLLLLNTTGLIATHDLSLCTLTDKYEQIQNAYFDGDILEDELHFDYKLKQGISKNRNASFLLKNMKIV